MSSYQPKHYEKENLVVIFAEKNDKISIFVLNSIKMNAQTFEKGGVCYIALILSLS